MDILSWIVMGLVAGFLASLIVNKRGEGILMDIVLGVIGAVVGGFLFRLVGVSGVTGFNIWSLLVAMIGAVLILIVWHVIQNNMSRHA